MSKSKIDIIHKASSFINATKLWNIYTPYYGIPTSFPRWVIENKALYDFFNFEDTVVFYNDNERLEDVIDMTIYREPVNIAMDRSYSIKNMLDEFGWQYGAYQKSTEQKLMPNIAIYCNALVKNPKNSETKNIHVINLVGYAFDNIHQPDYKYFFNKHGANYNEFKKELLAKYRKMWMLACVAAKEKGLKFLYVFNVGGSAFAEGLAPVFGGMSQELFIEYVFKPSFGYNIMDPTSPLSYCIKNGINILNKDFDGGFIPNILFNGSNPNIDKTLYVNAWDPWSIIGNGNEADRSLDGYWGRNSNLAVLGWYVTNPHMKFISIRDDCTIIKHNVINGIIKKNVSRLLIDDYNLMAKVNKKNIIYSSNTNTRIKKAYNNKTDVNVIYTDINGMSVIHKITFTNNIDKSANILYAIKK